MRVLGGYLMREIAHGGALVLGALLTLYGFFDLIHELNDVGKSAYELRHAIGFVLLSAPGHVYELFPIAALIGTVYALSQLAAHSEITVMRASGASLFAIGGSVARAGLMFALAAFLIGEYVAPASERAAQKLKLRASASVVAQEFRSGVWAKDEGSFINVSQVLPDSTLLGVRIYEFDDRFQLQSVSLAQRGEYLRERGRWRLTGVTQTHFDSGKARATEQPQMEWRSALSPELLAVLLVAPEQMSLEKLFGYIEHLRDNRQKTLRYEIALWRKLSFPLAVLVMMLMALPFAQHERRGGGIGAKVLAAIMLGLGFYLLNRVFAHLGYLNEWPAMLSAFLPTLVYAGLTLGAIWWVERR